MNIDRESLLLYAVTNQSWTKNQSIYEQVEEAIRSGVTMVQLREKEMDEEAFLQEALQMRLITEQYNIPLIINDNIEIALQSDADGVHVGQDDLEASIVRKKIGPNKILGVSAHSVEEAIRAQEQGADYLGVGSIFSTSTKQNVTNTSIEVLQEICQAVSIPVVAIGGIDQTNIHMLKGTGIDGIAVVSAIFSAQSIMQATKQLKISISQIINKELLKK